MKKLGFLIGAIFWMVSLTVNIGAGTDPIQEVTLKIDGITCGACIRDIRSALMKVDGVETVQIETKKKWLFFKDLSDARAMIRFDQGKATTENLIHAIEGASTPVSPYRATRIRE